VAVILLNIKFIKSPDLHKVTCRSAEFSSLLAQDFVDQGLGIVDFEESFDDSLAVDHY
jgi:hypothetical protein